MQTHQPSAVIVVGSADATAAHRCCEESGKKNRLKSINLTKIQRWNLTILTI
jgi:hypothetical protein